MTPPTSGPSTGPRSAGVVSQAMAPTKSFFGVLRATISRPTGTIIAPPMPCRNRATTKPESEVASVQASDPARNTSTAAANTRRAP
jgi:hypothetical protein